MDSIPSGFWIPTFSISVRSTSLSENFLMVAVYLFPSYFIVSSSASPMFCFTGETDIENRPMDMGDVESNMEIYNTICKIDSQGEFAV